MDFNNINELSEEDYNFRKFIYNITPLDEDTQLKSFKDLKKGNEKLNMTITGVEDEQI
jgi:hypothetical protein